MTAPLAVRLRQPLQDQVGNHGPRHTAARALILIGLAAIGDNVQPFKRDMQRLLLDDLDEAIIAKLHEILGNPQQIALHTHYDLLADDFEAVPVVPAVLEPENDAFDGWDV